MIKTSATIYIQVKENYQEQVCNNIDRIKSNLDFKMNV